MGKGDAITTVVAAAMGAVGARQLGKRYGKQRKRGREREKG